MGVESAAFCLTHCRAHKKRLNLWCKSCRRCVCRYCECYETHEVTTLAYYFKNNKAQYSEATIQHLISIAPMRAAQYRQRLQPHEETLPGDSTENALQTYAWELISKIDDMRQLVDEQRLAIIAVYQRELEAQTRAEEHSRVYTQTLLQLEKEQRDFEQQRARIVEHNYDFDELERKYVALKRKMAQLETQTAATTSDLTQTNVELLDTQSTLSTTVNKLRFLQRENETLKEQVSAYSESSSRFKTLSEDAASELAKYKSLYNKLTSRYYLLSEEYQQLVAATQTSTEEGGHTPEQSFDE